MRLWLNCCQAVFAYPVKCSRQTEYTIYIALACWATASRAAWQWLASSLFFVDIIRERQCQDGSHDSWVMSAWLAAVINTTTTGNCDPGEGWIPYTPYTSYPYSRRVAKVNVALARVREAAELCKPFSNNWRHHKISFPFRKLCSVGKKGYAAQHNQRQEAYAKR